MKVKQWKKMLGKPSLFLPSALRCYEMSGMSRYVQGSSRLDYTEETRLHFSPEEQKAWEERVNSGGEAESLSGFSPHFICECYFMTAKALHMGFSKLFSHFSYLQRVSTDVLPTCQDS